ncbi:MAG: hypothetical protein KBC48_02200 [Candidatus Pacebacteria bacterium]|nr:hypothetical protein [Candidatus Paceibacterota bacterium]
MPVGLVPAVQAESGSSISSVSDLEKIIQNLLKQIIELLEKQLSSLKEAKGLDDVKSEDKDEGLEEVEATIYTNETVVKVELDGEKKLFTTSKTSKSDLVNEIADRYDLDKDEVSDMIEIETEDRASRADDKDWADEDDDSDDDDEEDDNNSGHGNDDDDEDEEDDD